MASTARQREGYYAIVDPASQRRVTASKRPWLDKWMALLHAIGNVQAWILLTIFYIVVVTPIGLIFRFVADPLRLRRRESNWQPFASRYDRLEDAGEQA